MELEVAVVEVGQAGVSADDARLALGRDDEHLRGGSVVGAEAAVFGDAATEFGERGDHDSISEAVSFQVTNESGDRGRQLGQQRLMRIRLLRVRVEAIEVHKEHPRSHVAADDLGHGSQFLSQGVAGIRRRWFIAGGDLFELLGTRPRRASRASQEIEI